MTLDVRVRWFHPADCEPAARIERALFPHPWTDADFLAALADDQGRMQAAVDAAGSLVGYLVLKQTLRASELENAAVDSACQRMGVGRRLLAYEQAQHARGGHDILALVREQNLAAQLWLRACGFHAVRVVRRPWPLEAGDAYLFRWRPPKGTDAR